MAKKNKATETERYAALKDYMRRLGDDYEESKNEGAADDCRRTRATLELIEAEAPGLIPAVLKAWKF